MKNLEKYRKEIDQIDRQIFALLSKRLIVVRKIGRFKKKIGKPIRDPRREKEVLEEKAKLARKFKLSPDFVKKIWKLFFKEAYKNE